MKESIHQNLKDLCEMKWMIRKEKYIKSKNYQKMINLLTDTLKQFKKNKFIND